ncbi:hypothetical protein [Peptoniphilus indolicus]|nr:hypothetical protein [Peptoniphilus indolicus]SUB74422.1 Uncharacterised protein [Peptoniphilus indolicus]
MSKNFLLNINTGEIHNLSKQTPQCQINEIKNYELFDTYEECMIEAIFKYEISKPNGCHYCLPALDVE